MRQLKITRSITNRESEAVEKYLKEIDKIDMITPAEEVRLAILIKKGNKMALDKLTKANLRFVVSVAKQYQNKGLPLSDLINEGNLGLIKAAERFDETKGFKFISYAVGWIRQAILQGLSEHSRMVRIPQNIITFDQNVDKAIKAFEQQYEREPLVEEIAVSLINKISQIKNGREASSEEIANNIEDMVKKVNESLQRYQRHVSIDAPIKENSDTAYVDLLKSNSKTDHEVDHKESLKNEVERVLKSLSPREAEIVNAYFGLSGEGGITIEQIGQKYNLTKERIRQIKERAIKRLQKARYKVVLQSFLDK